MPQLNHTGPEGKGAKTGRKLGKCAKKGESEFNLGEGMGKARKAEKEECKGKGKRLKSSKLFNKQ